MEQSPSWKANNFSASPEIPHILWSPNVHDRIHKYPKTLPTLSQIDPAHNPKFHFLKIHFNIILPLRLGLPSGLFPSCFPTKALYTPLISPIRAACPTHLIFLDFITLKISGEEDWSLSSSLSGTILHQRPLRIIYMTPCR